jgi:hypothetical protein
MIQLRFLKEGNGPLLLQYRHNFILFTTKWKAVTTKVQ